MGEGAVGTGGRLTWQLLLILIPDLEQNHFQLGPCNQLMEELKENVICGGKKLLGSVSAYLFCQENTTGFGFHFMQKLIGYNL